MQSAAWIARFRCALCKHGCSGPTHSQAKAGRKQEADPEQPPPPKRRRVSKKLKNLGSLHLDILLKVAENLVGSPRHYLMLGMTCKALRQFTSNNHDSLRKMYERWEKPTIPRTRIRIAWPPLGGFAEYETIPNHIPCHRWPAAKPKDKDWYLHEIPEADRPHFNAYARKVLALVHVDRCGVCGTRGGNHQPYWSLGIRVCKFCIKEKLVSDRVLHVDYGIRLHKPVPGQSRAFGRIVAGKVFYFTQFTYHGERRAYSDNAVDFPNKPLDFRMYFFWRPHLEKLLDMPALRREWQQKKEAARLVADHFRMAQARNLWSSYKMHPRKDIGYFVANLRQDQMKRDSNMLQISKMLPVHLPADAFRREFESNADKLPEPWEPQN